jgi:multidrug efflux pump subunit AcrA (membrane-fusion protein)
MLGQDVRVTIRVPVSDEEVLAVPVSAIWSGADGSLHVTKLSDGRTEDVPVRLGASGDGLVEVVPVRPGSLQPGDLVVVG